MPLAGLPRDESVVQATAAPEDVSAAKEGMTGALATPRDTAPAGDPAPSKNPSIFGPLRYVRL